MSTARANPLPLRSGDIVFIAIPNALYRRVAEATESKASHVGIVFEDPKQGWLVAESTIPVVKYTALETFLAKSDGGWIAVRRLKGGLTDEQVSALRQACDKRLGKLYHQGFRYGSRRQFCSKLVYNAYLEALGVRVGEVETFSHLLARNPTGSQSFWKLWFFGFIPWSRLTVTPASLMNSDVLETIVSP